MSEAATKTPNSTSGADMDNSNDNTSKTANNSNTHNNNTSNNNDSNNNSSSNNNSNSNDDINDNHRGCTWVLGCQLSWDSQSRRPAARVGGPARAAENRLFADQVSLSLSPSLSLSSVDP